MIKIENVETVGWNAAIRGMRNPMNSWDKSDSYIGSISSYPYPDDGSIKIEYAGMNHDYTFCIGKNDQKLMRQLSKAGTADHRKFMRMIVVYMDITAPLYMWKEIDTYQVGVVKNSCSTMHKIHSKEFTLEDFSCEHLDTDLTNDKGFVPYSDMLDTAWPSVPANYHTAQSGLWLIVKLLNFYRQRYLDTKDKKYWWQLIQLLPSSYNQKRTVMLNYEVLRNMYTSRKNHKLDEWRNLCEFMKTLPMSDLITGDSIDED